MSPKYLEQIAIHTLKKREGGFTHKPPIPSAVSATATGQRKSRDSFSQVCKSLDTLFGYPG